MVALIQSHSSQRVKALPTSAGTAIDARFRRIADTRCGRWVRHGDRPLKAETGVPLAIGTCVKHLRRRAAAEVAPPPITETHTGQVEMTERPARPMKRRPATA